MIVEVVTPAPRGSRKGNRITALRWARILRRLGHRVRLRTSYQGADAALIVVLHARHGHAALVAAKAAAPTRPVILALTGTDLYVDGVLDPRVAESIERADVIVTLQPRAVDALPAAVRDKARVVRQSCTPPPIDPSPDPSAFEVVVVGHLRPVKDPLLTARASRRLPASSRIRVTQIGEALSPEDADAARAEEVANPRYRWLGGRPRRETLERITRARALVLTSRAEGGAQVVSEALACGTPVIATRIDGVFGLVGDDWPALFPVGDDVALARLLARAESDESFLADLTGRARALAPLYHPDAEVEAWRRLLEDVG